MPVLSTVLAFSGDFITFNISSYLLGYVYYVYHNNI